MADRIYVTYTPTGAPGSFHTAIHYERTDSAGHVINHHVIEAKPEMKDLTAPEKAIGVIEEVFRTGNAPSRFGCLCQRKRCGFPRRRCGWFFVSVSPPGIEAFESPRIHSASEPAERQQTANFHGRPGRAESVAGSLGQSKPLGWPCRPDRGACGHRSRQSGSAGAATRWAACAFACRPAIASKGNLARL